MIDKINPGFEPGNLTGRFEYQLFDAQGKPLTKNISKKNSITYAGKDAILNSFFNGVTAPPLWYIGLIDYSNFTTTALTDTMPSHVGWQPYLSYRDSNNVYQKIPWFPTLGSGASMSDITLAQFNLVVNAGRVNGIFICTTGATNSNTGLLWATGEFAAPLSVVAGDTLKIKYIVSS